MREVEGTDSPKETCDASLEKTRNSHMTRKLPDRLLPHSPRQHLKLWVKIQIMQLESRSCIEWCNHTRRQPSGWRGVKMIGTRRFHSGLLCHNDFLSLCLGFALARPRVFSSSLLLDTLSVQHGPLEFCSLVYWSRYMAGPGYSL